MCIGPFVWMKNEVLLRQVDLREAEKRGLLLALLSPQESQTKSQAEGAPLMRSLMRFGEGQSSHFSGDTASVVLQQSG